MPRPSSGSMSQRRRRCAVSALTMALCANVCGSAFAQPSAGTAAHDGISVPLKAGEAAPFDGELVAYDALARILADAERNEKVCAADKALLDRRLAVSEDARTAERAILSSAVTELDDTVRQLLQEPVPAIPLLERPAITMTLGVAAGALVVGLSWWLSAGAPAP